MSLSPFKKNFIEEISKELKKFNCALAIIFGSFLESENYRDIDIMISKKGGKSYSDAELINIKQILEAKFNRKFDLLNINVPNIPLCAEVAKKGYPIILDDEDLWDDFRFKAWIEEIDFRPFLERFYEERFDFK